MEKHELFEQAQELVIKEGYCTPSLLQIHFRIGYNLAEVLINQLEEAGIIGAFNGAKRRTVLVKSVGSYTWNSLLKAISNLSPEQREKQVFFTYEDESRFKKIHGLETIPEDVYINKDNDEDCGDLETLKEVHGDDFKEEDYELVTPKGTPFLWDGF